jgi:outer membrane protein assembly factor BamB
MKITKANLFISIVVIVIVLAGCIPLSRERLPTPTVVPSISHVVNDVVGIEPIWILEKAGIHLNNEDAALDSSAGKTCFLGDLGKNRDIYLKKNLACLDSKSGKLLWYNESGLHDSIAVTPNGIFITYITPLSIRKYDFQNGDLIWRKYLGGNGSDYLYFQDNQIEILDWADKTWVLDTAGKVVRFVDGESIFISQRDEILVDYHGLQSSQTPSGEVLWKYEDVRVNSAPLFTEDKIFVRGKFSKIVYALDRDTGTLLWKIPKILGNFAYSPDKQVVYALRENGELLSIDENSGKESLIAKFSPAPFLYSDGVSDCGYQLSYDQQEHILVVYTGDSRQLFAFREE